ncbi:MAG: VTT domain-containing protein [Oceanococcus sp.]
MTAEAAFAGPPWLAAAILWIQTHPQEAMLLLALAAAVEGLFLVGMLIPGSLLMFSAGAIAVAGEIPLTPVMLAAAIGAWLGDCLSFYLGWRWRLHLPDIAARLHMPRAIERGERFFRKHGGKSIFLGRFVGPLRPLVPAIAGASSMIPWHFMLIDLFAALLWAPAYALPGVLVGATISLAAEVATRLAVLAAGLFVLAWLIWWLVTLAVRFVQGHAEPWLLQLMDWSHKHRRLGRLGPALTDPNQPESPILLACLVLLSGLTWLLGQLWWSWPNTLTPPGIDAIVYDTLAALLTPGVEGLFGVLSSIGSLNISLLMGLGMLLLFASQMQHRMTAHWIAGLIGGGLIGLFLPGAGMVIKLDAALQTPAITAASLSVWLCLAGLLGSRKSSAVRISVYSGIGLIVGLMLLARLMLGQISFSQAGLATLASLIWCSLLTLGFRRHLRRPQIPALAPSVGLALLLLTIGLALHKDQNLTPITSNWDNTSQSPTRINLFWQGDIQSIRVSLASAGWSELGKTNRRDYVSWLLRESDARPPAPQWLAGQAPNARFVRKTAHDQTLILRLWQHPEGHYMGQAGMLVERHWADLMHVPLTVRDAQALKQLQNDLQQDWQITLGAREAPLFLLAPVKFTQ